MPARDGARMTSRPASDARPVEAHTPTPWVFDEGQGGDYENPEIKPHIGDADGDVLMECFVSDADDAKSVARKIEAMKRAVRAINAYDELVKALQIIKAESAGYDPNSRIGIIHEFARAALAKAGASS
jgi:hypothetical protein